MVPRPRRRGPSRPGGITTRRWSASRGCCSRPARPRRRVARLRDLVIDLGDSREHPSRHRPRPARCATRGLVVATWDADRDGVPAGRRRAAAAPDPRARHDHRRPGGPALRAAGPRRGPRGGCPGGPRRWPRRGELDAVNSPHGGRRSPGRRRTAPGRGAGCWRPPTTSAADSPRSSAAGWGRGSTGWSSSLGRARGFAGRQPPRAGRPAPPTGPGRKLDELAAGLRPRALADGLVGAAVRELAESVPLDVVVSTTFGSRLDEDTELAAYYVCAEALVNVVQARPGRPRVKVDLGVKRRGA